MRVWLFVNEILCDFWVEPDCPISIVSSYLVPHFSPLDLIFRCGVSGAEHRIIGYADVRVFRSVTRIHRLFVASLDVAYRSGVLGADVFQLYG